MGGTIKPPIPSTFVKMKTYKKWGPALISLVFCITAILSSCADQSITPPFTFYATLSQQIDLYDLQMAYYKDAVAADTMYLGKRYYFGLVRAEQTTSIFGVRGSEDYVLVENVKFVPSASYDMKGIIQGTIFEVIGDVQGVQSGYIMVKNCWFRIQSGGSIYTGGGAY
jgi:hypothetical protein